MLLQSNHLMDNNIFLYGASGHCKVIIDILSLHKVEINAIIDDDVNKKAILGIAVLHSSKVDFADQQKMIVAIGDNAIRKHIVKKLNSSYFTAIHPAAIVSNYSVINVGSVVMAGAVINADARIGYHCIINTGAIIEHDCQISDFVHVSPNATLSGAVTVMEGAHIGVGASVIQGVTIGKWATVGAGAVIIENVPDYAVVVGNPGRVIKNKQKTNE